MIFLNNPQKSSHSCFVKVKAKHGLSNYFHKLAQEQKETFNGHLI